jgi:hypothetical protein
MELSHICDDEKLEEEEPNEIDEKEIRQTAQRTHIAFKEKRLDKQRFILSFLPHQAGKY